MGIFEKALMFPSCFRPKARHHLDSINQIISKQSSTPRLSLSDISDPGSPSDLSNSVIASNLHIFTLKELDVITNHFSSSNFIGEGGFGPVHKGFIDDKCRPGLKAQPVAVKLLDLDGQQGHKEWLTEVVFLGQLRHPNLVRLIGYCCEDEHRLLVYEYMARGNLENHLFRRYTSSLSWLTRIKIAVGAAKGLAFLHGEEKPVIYRDFKTSNILLDTDYTAKLSDFGLAKDGPEGDDTHVSTRVMGTHGYAAPEYVMTGSITYPYCVRTGLHHRYDDYVAKSHALNHTVLSPACQAFMILQEYASTYLKSNFVAGHLTTMNDIYSFGVVLLELLTGKRAMDKKRHAREQNLVEWAKPYLKDHHKINRLMDPRLEGQYSTQGANKIAALAHRCLNHQPKSRPNMKHVVKILEAVMEYTDIPSGHFVYIAPIVEKIEKTPSEQRENEAGENRRKGYRHNHKLSSRAVYSDTALFKTSRDEIES